MAATFDDLRAEVATNVGRVIAWGCRDATLRTALVSHTGEPRVSQIEDEHEQWLRALTPEA
jgi:hypothetical protein